MSDHTDIYVYFDLETTGFSFRRDEITEIGAVSVVNGTTAQFSVLVRTENPIPERIERITGISNTMLMKTGVPKRSALRSWCIWLRSLSAYGNIILVGHNALQFDIPFLLMSAMTLGLLEVFTFHSIIDTMVVSSTTIPRGQRTLAKIHQRCCGSTIVGAHRALTDAEATLHVFQSEYFTSIRSRNHANIGVYSYNKVLSIFWERYIRLSKSVEYVGECTVCGEIVSPYFKHYHTMSDTQRRVIT